jgi:hypothetical protein
VRLLTWCGRLARTKRIVTSLYGELLVLPQRLFLSIS